MVLPPPESGEVVLYWLVGIGAALGLLWWSGAGFTLKKAEGPGPWILGPPPVLRVDDFNYGPFVLSAGRNYLLRIITTRNVLPIDVEMFLREKGFRVAFVGAPAVLHKNIGGTSYTPIASLWTAKVTPSESAQFDNATALRNLGDPNASGNPAENAPRLYAFFDPEPQRRILLPVRADSVV